MNIAELSPQQLDLLIAKQEGLHVDGVRGGAVIVGETPYRSVYAPTSNWCQGGPLIEREHISMVSQGSNLWTAGWVRSPFGLSIFRAPCGSGSTPLVAAMRALVARHALTSAPSDSADPSAAADSL